MKVKNGIKSGQVNTQFVKSLGLSAPRKTVEQIDKANSASGRKAPGSIRTK